MHPTLPSGVHLKALETYELIFTRIGHKGLAQDLFIYSAGLFPLLGNAAMSTRPLLMTVYENYFLPLGKALLPGLSGLLLGLLPGIEEGSEYTDRFVEYAAVIRSLPIMILSLPLNCTIKFIRGIASPLDL